MSEEFGSEGRQGWRKLLKAGNCVWIVESAEAAAAAHTSLFYGISKNQNQFITMGKRDKA